YCGSGARSLSGKSALGVLLFEHPDTRRQARMSNSTNKTELRNEQVWLVVGSLMIIATVALAAALIYTRDVTVPFVLAIFMTAAVAPLVDIQVSRWGFPGWLAVLITLFIVLAVLTGMFLVLIAVVQAIVRVANEYSEQVVHLAENLLNKLKHYNIHVDEAKIIGELETRLPGVISSTVGTVTAIVSHGFLIAFFVVFLLLGRNPQHRRTGIYADIENTIRSYITTMTAISALTSVLVGLVLWALGIHMAWLFAF